MTLRDTTKAVAVTGLLFAAAFGLAALILFGIPQAQASAPSGLPATVATSSNPTVTTTASLVIATSTACSARIVTTVASPIMLTFSDNQGKVPTGTYGHLQPASTTVAYDSGQYGCGAVRIYSFVSSAITVTETR